jgi:hypothetical protein
MADATGSTAPPAPRPFLEFRPLLRAPRIASDPRKIILATIGLLALFGGWLALAYLFGRPQLPPDQEPGLLGRDSSLPGWSMARKLPSISMPGLFDAADDLSDPFQRLSAPPAALFSGALGPAEWFQAALMTVWAVVVWGIAGGAIARIAVVEAASDRRGGLGAALRFALGKSISLIGAPLTPLLAVAILAAGCALFGLLYRIPAGIGGWLANVLGFIPLLLGLVMALILVGLTLGWPLMLATIAADGEDAPDALSRSYSYVNQRLGRYLAHAFIALVIGSVSLMAVVAFARAVLTLAEWGISLGAPALDQPDEGTENLRLLFWVQVVGLFVLAWVYSYFWSAVSIIYLILRRDVDGTPWHEVYLPKQAGETPAGRPPLESTKESAPAASVAP